MTDEKRTTDIPSEASSQPSQPIAKSRTEARAAHAATAQATSDNEQVTRSKRKAQAKPIQEEPARNTRTKQEVKSETEEATKTKPVRWVQIRILPIYVRVLLVIILLVAAAIIGALIGYSVLGDGSASGIFQKETWTHIFDIMSGKEK